jgi:hypothetical protein
VEPVTVVPDDSDADDACCVYKSLGDENDEDSASGQDAQFVFEQVDELCGNFENEYGDFLTATKPSPSDVERDEVNKDIPARFFTNITMAGGSRQDKIDKNGTEPLAKGGDANAAEGRALPVLGSARILLGLWGRTYDVPVRVMRTFPTGILLGRLFLIKHGVDLDFASLRGSFHKVIRGRRAVLSGRLRGNSGPEGEEVAVSQEAGLADVIEKMDLADLGEEFEAMGAVLRRNIEVFRGLGKAEGEEFHIKVPPNFDMSQLDSSQHRR